MMTEVNSILYSWWLLILANKYAITFLHHPFLLSELPVTHDEQTLSYKQNGQSYFVTLAIKYRIMYLPELPCVVVAFSN